MAVFVVVWFSFSLPKISTGESLNKIGIEMRGFLKREDDFEAIWN